MGDGRKGMGESMIRLTLLALLWCCPVWAGDLPGIDPAPYMPDDVLTPGVIRPELTLETICATKWGKDRRAVTEAMKRKVFEEYGYPLGQKDPRCPCEIDHRYPRSIGGADAVENLSVQSYRGPWNAHDKDRAEDIAAASICKAGGMSLDAARAMFAGKWSDAYMRLFGVPPDAR